MDNDLDFLYQENILEHNRNPKNKIEDFSILKDKNILNTQKENSCLTCIGVGDNFDCGDKGEIFLEIKNDKNTIQNIFWIGNGCAISQAGMSLITEEIKNKKLTLKDLKTWTPSKIYEILGIKISPSRVNCALLSYKCLEDILKKIK